MPIFHSAINLMKNLKSTLETIVKPNKMRAVVTKKSPPISGNSEGSGLESPFFSAVFFKHQ